MPGITIGTWESLFWYSNTLLPLLRVEHHIFQPNWMEYNTYFENWTGNFVFIRFNYSFNRHEKSKDNRISILFTKYFVVFSLYDVDEK